MGAFRVGQKTGMPTNRTSISSVEIPPGRWFNLGTPERRCCVICSDYGLWRGVLGGSVGINGSQVIYAEVAV